MVGLRHRAGRVTRVTKAVLAAVLLGGTLTAGLSLALATQATAFSATPAWFTTAGTPASTLTCGTWYFSTMGAQTGGGSATISLAGGGGGGGGSSTETFANEANTATGGAGAQLGATVSVPAGESIATMIGCGGGGGGEHTSGTSSTGGASGVGYSPGGLGGEQTNTETPRPRAPHCSQSPAAAAAAEPVVALGTVVTVGTAMPGRLPEHQRPPNRMAKGLVAGVVVPTVGSRQVAVVAAAASALLGTTPTRASSPGRPAAPGRPSTRVEPVAPSCRAAPAADRSGPWEPGRPAPAPVPMGRPRPVVRTGRAAAVVVAVTTAAAVERPTTASS
jgi:hypothetical protein